MDLKLKYVSIIDRKINSFTRVVMKVFKFYRVVRVLGYPVFLMSLLVLISASPRSTGHTLFVDPFLDPYVETLLYMDTKDIITISKLNDNQFVQYLFSNDNDVARNKRSFSYN